MEKQKNNNGVIALVVAVVGFFVFKNRKPKTPNPTDWNGSGNGNLATITYNEALDIVKKIQAEIGYLSTGWSKISLQFMRLRNDRDIELLYKAWGTWDGPQVINGDLFNALNMAYTIDLNPGKQALTVIKQYSFSYAKNWKW